MTNHKIMEQVFINKPLLLFSVFSQIQADNLIDIGNDISKRISRMLRINGQIGPEFNKTYGYLSLWILGAYELVRTLDAENNTFKKETKDKINSYKKKIAKIRVPIAKQELAGKEKVRVTIPQSVYGIDFKKKDLQFKIGDEDFYFKELLAEFKTLIKSITIESYN
jgi:hypothetical protein